MRLYARSDMLAVAIPSESGGCGETHVRPVVQGAPAKLWPLDCLYCTAVLREDPLWTVNKLKIPLTPDEESLATEMEKQGDQVMHQVSAALAQSSIQGLRDSQQASLESQQKQAEHDRMEARYNELTDELARLRKMVGNGSVTTSASGSQDEPDVRQEAPQAPSGTPVTERTPKTVTAVTGASGACKSCGGPLRLKGQRGPTPKGTCMSCRAKAQAA